ncbi:MAG: AEC family transporter [Oscillospiraceae bacterium]|nr:AEC family transporter [Oscillospiraceae bacterium]
MAVMTQVSIMSLLIMLGMVLYKIKIIDKPAVKTLSDIVVFIANPAAVFLAFRMEYSEELAYRLGYAFLLAALCYVVVILCAVFLVRGAPSQRRAVERVSVVLSNCGFMGIPLVQGLYGGEGVFFLAAFIAGNSVVTWTYGVFVIRNATLIANDIKPSIASKIGTTLKSLPAMLNTPMIYAILLGTLFFTFKIPLPDIPLRTIGLLGNMTLPCAMLAAGATVIQADFKKLIKNLRLYYVCFLKLIIVPLAVYGVFLLLPRDELIMRVHLTASACPTAVLCTVIAVKHDCEGVYSSEIFAVVTLLSMVTLPLVIQLP